LLDVQKTDRVIDWFCGLGNFTLPLATLAREVLGIEGSDTLVARAKANAEQNLRQKKPLPAMNTASSDINFVARNLFEMTGQMLVDDGYANRWLIDPPREGAFALVKALAQIHQQRLGNVPEVVEGEAVQVAVNIGDWQPPQHARAGRWSTRASSRLPLHISRRGQHVPAYRACGEHGGV
jgi:23S rRNA (uracil1939-C5)-methyltransferase